MLGRGVLLAVAVAFGGSPAAGLPVRVELDWPAGRPASTSARARLQAVRTAGPVAGGAPVAAEAGPEGVVLDLGEGVWQVQATAPGYWSAGAEVTVGAIAPPNARITLWPAAALHGEIATAGGQPLPRDVVVRLSAVPRPEPGPARAELRCRVDAGSWSCLGPAGRFDVQIEAAGYSPRYAWDVGLAAAARTDLGRTVLRRAASVFGRAVRQDGAGPGAPCRATLRDADPAWRGSLPPDPRDAAAAEAGQSVPVTPRGYFQLVGVRPGRYVLAVECEGASGVRELRVTAHRESRLDPPLLLEELTLDVVVAPTLDPHGRPWRLAVDATTPQLRRIADGAGVPADGRFVRRGLTAGSYRVALVDADGRQWLLRFVELGADSRPVSMRVRPVEVAGQVRLGARPLRARLVFASEAGGEPATLASDDEGRFQGVLSWPGEAAETRWTVEVHASRPSLSRRLEGVLMEAGAGGAAWLELVLPAAVRGTVVSESGKPRPGVEVRFESVDSAARTAVTTDDAGAFEVPDLAPGRYAALARSAAGASDPAEVDVAEGLESELRLVLRTRRTAFLVVGSEGPVADAAVQVWVPPGVPRGFARTGPDGRFEMDLPPGTADVGLTVGAPGHPLKLTRLAVGDEPAEQTVTLGSSAGTLQLHLQRPGPGAEASATAYLVREGAVEAAAALAGWGSSQDAAGGPGPAVVEAIEPGVYALCLASDEELASLWRGTLPPRRCRSGSLEAGRTLTLSPP